MIVDRGRALSQLPRPRRSSGRRADLECGGWICPLTPLENQLRQASGEAGYPCGFIEHYLIPVVYPAELTPEIQIQLGLGVLLINVIAYSFVWRSRSRGM